MKYLEKITGLIKEARSLEAFLLEIGNKTLNDSILNRVMICYVREQTFSDQEIRDYLKFCQDKDSIFKMLQKQFPEIEEIHLDYEVLFCLFGLSLDQQQDLSDPEREVVHERLGDTLFQTLSGAMLIDKAVIEINYLMSFHRPVRLAG